MVDDYLYRTTHLAQQLEGVMQGEDFTLVARNLLVDSRKLVSPLDTIFFAISSQRNDGHKYIPGLFEKGVRLFIGTHELPHFKHAYPGAAYIKVKDSLTALQQVAASHRKKFDLPIVGITGSNGKTIVKEWLFQLLNNQCRIVRNPRSYNSQIGVPLSVWQIQKEDELAIFEAGISCPGEMGRLEKVLKPLIGIITNIGPAHDEFFESREQKLLEKLKLFENSDVLIYCSDQKMVHEVISEWHKERPSVKLFRWGFDRDSEMCLQDVTTHSGKTLVMLQYHGLMQRFPIPFADPASVENALHCAAFLCYLGMDPENMADAFAALQAVAMRLDLKQGINQCSVINDTYNSDLNSLSIALDFLALQNQHSARVLVLSDILQSGVEPSKLYSSVADLLRKKGVTRLIGIGEAISSQKAFFQVPAEFYPSTDEFLSKYDFTHFNNEAILLKGARSFEFERINALLQLKDHETILEIDLDALIHNLNVYRSMLKPGVKLMAMVKAFGYGSGSNEIANALQYHHADYLAVAYADEGKELRKSGIRLPIMVMNPELKNLEVLFKYQLEPEIYSLRLLEKFFSALKIFPQISAQNPLNIHLKVDTGMHRLGFDEKEFNEAIQLVLTQDNIRIKSIFSHLAASDEEPHDAFTQRQISLFGQMARKAEALLGYEVIKHIVNSAGIARFPEAHFNMVRLGIGLYGVAHNEKLQSLLHPVGTLKSVVSQVKSIEAGETVGYSRKGAFPEGGEIAIVPIGYADGLNRRLGNGRGHLFIGGHLVPIVGNVCMDMCMADVSGLGIKEGDEVEVFGKNIPVLNLANELETIPYEILTSVSARVKRVYFRE